MKRELGVLGVGGVVLWRWAVEAGWSKARVHRALVREGWTLVRRGAWAAPGVVVDLRVRLLAEQLLKPRLVVSHRAAAWVHGVEVLEEREEYIERRVAQRQRHRHRETDTRVHHLPLQDSEVVWIRHGLRVTDVRRTLGDLLRCGPRDEAVVAVDSAISERTMPWGRRPALIEIGAIREEVEAAARGRRGSVRALRWLELADEWCGSPAETIARLRMWDAGLVPETQVRLEVPGGARRFRRPDFLFRAEGVVVEVEGYRWHGSREAHRSDLVRFNELMRCPEVRKVLRFAAVDVFRRPDAMIAEIRGALGSVR